MDIPNKIIKKSCPRMVLRGNPKKKEKCDKEIYKHGVCKYHFYKHRGYSPKYLK